MMLCEEQATLVLRDAASKHHSYDAQSPIQLPDAGRALPPVSSSSSSSSTSSSTTTTGDQNKNNVGGGGGGGGAIPTRVKRWALALLLGRALPPAPPTFTDTLAAPIAWHSHQPRLATVDGQGRVLIYDDPAGPGVPGQSAEAAAAVNMKPPSVLRHSVHAGTRALAWRPRAGATLAVGGSHGVCVWSHEPGHGGSGFNGGGGGGGGGGGAGGGAGASAGAGGKGGFGVVGGGGGPAAVKKIIGGGRGRIGGAPEWKLRRLRDVDDGGGSFGDDPFNAAVVSGVSRVVNTLRRLVPKPLRGGGGGMFHTMGGDNVSGGSSSSSSSSSLSGSSAAAPPYDTLSWSPCGRLLAAGGADRRAVSLWDLNTGECTKVASGVSGVSLLRWSPCGKGAHAPPIVPPPHKVKKP